MKTAKYSLWHFSGFVEVWLESWERKSPVNPEPSQNLEQRRDLEGKKVAFRARKPCVLFAKTSPQIQERAWVSQK